MKKSKIFNMVAISALMVMTTSCGDDFLSTEPASSVPINGYYTTSAHIDEAVTAAYNPLQWYDYFNGWSPLFLVSDAQGDDIYVGGGSTSDQAEIHLASQYKSTSLMNFSGAWTTSYSGINRCNRIVMDCEEAGNGITDAQKKYYVAEAQTLRSFYYLQLWKFWGNVPYYADKNLEYPYLADQLSHDEIYSKVIATLENVIEQNVLPMKETAARSGHATQAFAMMLYADWVMYQKDESRYPKALEYMEQIIHSGKYRLMPNFQSIFDQNNEWCDESIFEIDYYSQGSIRAWGSANSPGGTVVPALIGVDGLSGSPDYVGGWGFCDVSKEVYDQYEDGDQRRDGGILCMEKYIADNAAKGIKVSYGGRYQNTGLFLRKYLGRIGGNTGAGTSDLGWDNNQRIYRYAETLLNASELALRTGDQEKADLYLKMVRDRAGVKPITATLDNLLNERRLEFVGEGKRYYDLIRFGKAAEVLKPGGGKVLNKAKTAYDVVGIPERIQWTESKKYLPIPQDEIEASKGGLKQNDY